MEGKVVRLRAHERSDIDEFMRFVNDEELKRFLAIQESLKYPLSRMQEEEWIELCASGAGPDRHFVIETLKDRQFLGQIGLEHIDWVDRRANLALFLFNKQERGKGYGTDALQVLLRLALAKLGFYRIGLRVAASNTRAIRCYERCGFNHEGVLRCDRFLDGRLQDSLMIRCWSPSIGRWFRCKNKNARRDAGAT